MAPELAPDADLERERELIERAQGGDPRAMRPIFEQYAQPLYAAVILPRVGEVPAAEDVLRDTFITAIEKIQQFKWTGRSIFAWLRQIAINKVYDLHRQTQRTRRLMSAVALEAEAHSLPDYGADVLLIAAEEQRHSRDRIDATLALLSERYRTAIELRLIDELSREECAERLGVTVGTFDVLLYRAVRSFRKHFGSRP